MTPVAQIPALKTLSLFRCNELTDCSCLQNASSVQFMEIRECHKLKDFAFLENMQNLRVLTIDSPFFTAEKGFSLHEKTGIEVHMPRLRDADAETLNKLGCDPHDPHNHPCNYR